MVRVMTGMRRGIGIVRRRGRWARRVLRMPCPVARPVGTQPRRLNGRAERHREDYAEDYGTHREAP